MWIGEMENDCIATMQVGVHLGLWVHRPDSDREKWTWSVTLGGTQFAQDESFGSSEEAKEYAEKWLRGVGVMKGAWSNEAE